MRFWIPAFAGMTVMQRSPSAGKTEGDGEGMGPRIREDNGGGGNNGGREEKTRSALAVNGINASDYGRLSNRDR